jgi:hypothetical protein
MPFIDYNLGKTIEIWEGISGTIAHSDQATYCRFTIALYTVTFMNNGAMYWKVNLNLTLTAKKSCLQQECRPIFLPGLRIPPLPKQNVKSWTVSRPQEKISENWRQS